MSATCLREDESDGEDHGFSLGPSFGSGSGTVSIEKGNDLFE